MAEEKMYCGIGKIPNGQLRGTPRYCAKIHQVRYYGLEAINKKALIPIMDHTDLTKAKLKLSKLADDAKILLKDYRLANQTLADERSTNTQKKNAEKKLETVRDKKNTLVKKLKQQKKVIQNIEKEIEREKKKKKRKKNRE